MVKTCQIVYLFCNFFCLLFFLTLIFFSTTSSHRVWICFSHSLLAIESKLLELLYLNHGQNTYWKNIEIPFFVSSCMLLDDSHLNYILYYISRTIPSLWLPALSQSPCTKDFLHDRCTTQFFAHSVANWHMLLSHAQMKH